MEELMQDKENNIDLNNNGIPDKFEYQEASDLVDFKPQGNAFDNAYENEEQIKSAIPNYREYQWYKEPNEGYFYSLCQRIEDLVESNPEESKKMLEQIADTNPDISKSDVEPLVKEAEQLTDDNPNNDEVDNQAVKEVSQKIFDEMTLDDIEKADAAAMKGEGDYITVAKDLGFDDEDDFLYYFEQAGYKPEDVENLTEEQREEIRKTKNKDDKFTKLKNFLSGFDINVNTETPIQNDIQKEEKPFEGGSKPTVGHSFLGGSGSGVISVPRGIKTNKDVNNSNNVHSSAGGPKTNVKVEEVDANTASMNGANDVEHLDDTLDSLGFKDIEHEENIKTNEQADLPNGETWTENNDHWELPDIKKMMEEQGGGIYLPFKFTIENGELYVSQIGTGRKLPFDDFLKVEPLAAKQMAETINKN